MYFDVPTPSLGGESSQVEVYISEVNYHDVSDDDDLDFLEIHNASDVDVVLNQWCLSGVDFCFADDVVLAAGDVAVINGGDVEGKFSNSGETLQLTNAAGDVVDEVSYSDSAPWPKSADGRGRSLHRVRHSRNATTTATSVTSTTSSGAASANSVLDWIDDVPSPGSAYEEDFRRAVRDVSVVISEIHFHPENDNPAEEFIELTNVSSEAVSLTNWCLVEINRCFTDGDVIEASGSRVVVPLESKSELSNSRGVLRLVDEQKNIVDVAYYEDSGLWPALADGHGWSVHRRNGQLWGTEPGNWDGGDPSPGFVGAMSSTQAYLPTFENVSATVSPTATQEMQVSATIRDGGDATLSYKIGFADDVEVAMRATTQGVVTAIIPTQAAGSLVRYKMSSTEGTTVGTWPRMGDGMVYRGTVVQSDSESSLPRMQWFVEDDYYSQIFNDPGLFGDNGYPTVIAFDGEVFDGAKIRMRGNQSRLNPKKKWKVVLPPGHETTLGGLLASPVNEFALNSSFTDKSFVREILTSELQEIGRGIGQQVFPLRFEKNNEFYGLYLYQEQPDGQWREKFGFSRDTAVFKSDRQATLRINHLDLPNSELLQRYQRRSQRWLKNVDEVRDLIRQVNNENQAELLDFAYKHLDIPQIIEALATMRVAQHLEWEHKNHMLLFDPADQKWRLVPIDFDLNFGRQWVGGCNAVCDTVSATAYMEYMEGNRLGRLFLKTPELREMLDRRTKTLADVFLAEGYLEKRIAELEAMLRDDAALDRQNWSTYGQRQTMQQAQQILIDSYVKPKRDLLTGPESPRLPGPQSDTISYTMAGVDEVTITNTDTAVIDVSGIELPTMSARVPAGTVLRPGQSVVLMRERIPHSKDPRQLEVWVPTSS